MERDDKFVNHAHCEETKHILSRTVRQQPVEDFQPGIMSLTKTVDYKRVL